VPATTRPGWASVRGVTVLSARRVDRVVARAIAWGLSVTLGLGADLLTPETTVNLQGRYAAIYFRLDDGDSNAILLRGVLPHRKRSQSQCWRSPRLGGSR
jgi:hypothetical protein